MTLRSCLKLNFRILFKFSLKLNPRILDFRSFWKLRKLKYAEVMEERRGSEMKQYLVKNNLFCIRHQSNLHCREK